jgi:hypothetical protein
MRYQSELENLYDFKKEMMDVIPDIVRMTLDDCHGNLEQLVVDNMDKLQERHWKAVFDSQYNELFQDGIPHVSWNTDRSKILNSLVHKAIDERSRDYRKITVDSWTETWSNVTVMYVRTPGGTVIKYKKASPRVWDSRSNTRYYGTVVPPEEVPEAATHTVVLIGCDIYGKASVYDQFTGTMGQCEDWLAEQARCRRREMPEVKFIKLKD